MHADFCFKKPCYKTKSDLALIFLFFSQSLPQILFSVLFKKKLLTIAFSIYFVVEIS